MFTQEKLYSDRISHYWNTICINVNALPAHLAHCDCIGPCNSFSLIIANTQNNSDVKETIFTAFPNPLKENTTISLSVKETDLTSLEIYDYFGKRVASLFNQQADEGQLYNIEFDTKEISSGIYFCVLKTSIDQQLIKLVILK